MHPLPIPRLSSISQFRRDPIKPQTTSIGPLEFYYRNKWLNRTAIFVSLRQCDGAFVSNGSASHCDIALKDKFPITWVALSGLIKISDIWVRFPSSAAIPLNRKQRLLGRRNSITVTNGSIGPPSLSLGQCDGAFVSNGSVSRCDIALKDKLPITWVALSALIKISDVSS
ncbi:hypothetical protein CDAR_237811 [Caerostris darwini]|uniref:Ribosomal protein S2 n=1 Tax=Caerostris darwini TaxID=1538125 RepID=A0AAV4S272_9ARAC|nr:hypothetical protein CDAR_237811 [Caerostris darwini]